jgi:class 3 adenylate cyclase
VRARNSATNAPLRLSPYTPTHEVELARRDKSPGVLSEHDVDPMVRASSDASPDGERKTLTALFADIRGSMELMEELDPEEARTIIDPALKLMIEAV